MRKEIRLIKLLTLLVLGLFITTKSMSQQCDANFGFYGGIGGNDNTFQFIDSSTSVPDNPFYEYQFGDGNYAYEANPLHTYAEGGSYNVCLTLYDSFATCFDTVCKVVSIEVEPAFCDAYFYSFADTGASGTVNFISQSETSNSSNTSYSWDFGDGARGVGASVTHDYEESGTYVACLTQTVFNADFSDTCVSTYCDTLEVEVDSSGSGNEELTCSASFEAYADTSSGSWFFFNKSIHNGDTAIWSWDYGDRSQRDYAHHGEHTYSSEGYYKVCLFLDTYKGSESCTDTFCHTIYVEPAPSDDCEAYFSYTQNGDTVAFENLSKGASNSYSWTFGDGGRSTAENPVWVYNQEGTYKVCLTLTSLDSVGDTCVSTYCHSISFVDSNFNRYGIYGRAYMDANANGTFDESEAPLEGIFIETSPGNIVLVTDKNGFYLAELNDAALYTVSANSRVNWVQTEPDTFGSHRVNINDSVPFSGYHDFGFKRADNIKDVRVSLTPIGASRPGFDKQYRLSYHNIGSLPVLNGEVSLLLDANLHFVSASEKEQSFNAASRTVTWNYDTLMPGDGASIKVFTRLDSNTGLGSSLNCMASITPEKDFNSEDNTDYDSSLVTGSYDPNDKLVSPFGVQEANYIGLDVQTLTYTIRCQNTGTDTAFNIRIEDELDPLLQIGSIEVIDASNDYRYEVRNGNNFVVYFDNILLPDSNRDEPNSHGFVKFKIDLAETIVQDNLVQNTAKIYFDFNAPIITNTTKTTYGEAPLGIKKVFEDENVQISVYPNPVFETTNLTVVAKGLESLSKIRLIDSNGKTIKNWNTNGDKIQHVNPGSLKSGLYMLIVSDSMNYYPIKLLVQ